MSQEITKQAQELFDTPEKWEAFLELKNQSDKIYYSMFGKLKPLMHKKFIEEDVVAGWEAKQFHTCDMRWYLKEFGEQSISLYWGWHKQIRLWVFPDKNDVTKIHELMKTSEYAKLFSGFERVDGSISHEYIAYEEGNFHFDSDFDGYYTDWQLAWYAGNRSSEFVEQIAAKVNRFRKDEALTELLYKLNKETKR